VSIQLILLSVPTCLLSIHLYMNTHTHLSTHLFHLPSMYLRGSFAKFVDSPYYSESELCGGAVTVPFSKYPPWQAMHFLQRSTHFSKTCCGPLLTSKSLVLELPFHGWKSPKIAWGDLDCMADVLMGFHRSTFSKPNTEINSDLAP
jgi:hypothetical protein